jgi:hypothetical protein
MLNWPKKVIAVSTKRFNIFPYESTLEIWKEEKTKNKKKPIEWYISYNTYSILYLCWTQFKLFTKGLTRKRWKFHWYLSKLLRIKLPACEKIFVIPTIALLLQIHPKKKKKTGVGWTLYTCSSTVEILTFFNLKFV